MIGPGSRGLDGGSADAHYPGMGIRSAFTLAALLAGSFPALAHHDGSGTSHSRVGLLQGWAEPDGSRIVALAFELEPGWKTYWRTPGEAGIAPVFDWTGSRNIVRADILWPVPTIMESFGLRVLGFADRLVLPVRLTLADPAAPADIALRVDYGVCSDVCVRESGTIAAAVDAAPAGGAGEAPIRAALAAQPRKAQQAGVVSVSCRLTPDGDTVALEAEIGFDAPLPPAELLVVESPLADLWVAPAVAVTQGDRLTAATRVEYFGTGPLALDRSTLRLTLIGPDGAVEIDGCPAPAG